MTDNDKNPEKIEKDDTELSIGERIQMKRKELDLTVDELALLIVSFDYHVINESDKGISVPTIYRYEKGEREPGTREIKLLCYSLNVSADWLIFGKIWNNKQAADTKLANDFRSVIKQAYDDKTFQLVFDENRSRNETHQLKLFELKQKRGSQNKSE